MVGAVYKSLQQYDNAIGSFTQAVRLKPDYAEAYNNLGAACHDARRYDDAIFSYSKAIEHNTDFFEAYRQSGQRALGLRQAQGCYRELCPSHCHQA